jgi:hypothetical protein
MHRIALGGHGLAGVLADHGHRAARRLDRRPMVPWKMRVRTLPAGLWM